jgi:hypothetical protein
LFVSHWKLPWRPTLRASWWTVSGRLLHLPSFRLPVQRNKSALLVAIS